MSELYRFLLGALCVWRITHLLHAEDGPWDVLERLRRKAGTGVWASLLDCFYCLSIWLAAPFAYLLGETALERILLWPALSAAASLVESASRREVPAAAHWEDPEIDHVLRTKEHPLPETAAAPGAAADR